ncbi:MAG: uracil-DNA glycosylase [Alphaproteobacteria bacterium]|nr:uracil-DNA glycosylase [Alphaproteobacteria bacterium]
MPDPVRDCPLCPRLVDFRLQNRDKYPQKHNAPVPAFGNLDAPLLIVGLAPGLKGANFTGRPFTGDYAGELLYGTLLKLGMARGTYAARPDDGLILINCRITNAVRCVPQQNKPLPAEIKTCNNFLQAEIAAMSNLKAIFSLGRVSHEAVLRALKLKAKDYPFAHGSVHKIPGGLALIDSYHCSRYNTQTKRLTAEMFETAMRAAQSCLTC